MSATSLWIICAAIVVALAVWLVAVELAGRRRGARSRTEPRRGRVQGSTHLGGGRSVAPRRDGEITPDEDPDKPTVPVRRHGASPMDL